MCVCVCVCRVDPIRMSVGTTGGKTIPKSRSTAHGASTGLPRCRRRAGCLALERAHSPGTSGLTVNPLLYYYCYYYCYYSG